MNNPNTNPLGGNLSPILVVGQLDMIGQTFCILADNGPDSVPPEILNAACAILRSVRDSIAVANGLSFDSQHESPAFMAEYLLAELNEGA